nr:MAG TPA: helix-turn-helix domain protein [Caudoviricetes sp.]
MSMRLMAQAMSIKVGNPLRKLVLIKLADNANDDGICFPSYQYIADVCEISKASARTHIDALIKMGFVSKKARKNKDGSSSNLYLLHLEKGMPADSTGMPADSTGMPADSTGGMPADSTITYHSINQSSNLKKTKQKSAVVLLAEFGINGQLAEDFIAHRKSKRAAITKTVLVGYQREAHKAGIPLAEAITISIERNWQGFKAEWNWHGDNIATATNTRKTSAFADDGSWAVGRKLNIDPELIPEELR